MVGSISNESEDEGFSTVSHQSNDGPNISGSLNRAILKKGPWTTSEDAILVDYVKEHGEGNWNAVQKHTGLSRCGKSCRLRWANHLRPNLKKGAFTVEEERLIIELHAKLGNKWARMAAQLPGRTDNEIKNYWNTRIKRRLRAGLSLYPPELGGQTQSEDLQNLNSPGLYSGDNVYRDLFQSSNYQAPDLMFDSSKHLPYRPEISDTSASDSLLNSFGQFCTFVPQMIGLQRHAQEPDEPMSDYGNAAVNHPPPFNTAQSDSYEKKIFQPFGLGLPYDPPDYTKQVLSFSVNQDSHFMSNDIFFASMPFEGAEKYELPSFQCQETGLGVWDPAPKSLDYFDQSSLYGQLPSHCPPGSSGLLDDLLYEAKARSKSGSVSNAHTPTDTIGSSFEENIPEHNGKSKVDGESWTLYGESKEMWDQVNCSRPDALLGSCWLRQGASYMSAGTSASSWGLRSCKWNNMPSVCQMSELP